MLLQGDLGISHLQREDAFSFYFYCFYNRGNQVGRIGGCSLSCRSHRAHPYSPEYLHADDFRYPDSPRDIRRCLFPSLSVEVGANKLDAFNALASSLYSEVNVGIHDDNIGHSGRSSFTIPSPSMPPLYNE
jgi:hypothetical protein